jgi:hypothetical protein
MLVKGWVAVEWGVTAREPPRPLLPPDAGGRKRLNAELARFDRVSRALNRVLEAT